MLANQGDILVTRVPYGSVGSYSHEFVMVMHASPKTYSVNVIKSNVVEDPRCDYNNNNNNNNNSHFEHIYYIATPNVNGSYLDGNDFLRYKLDGSLTRYEGYNRMVYEHYNPTVLYTDLHVED
jgi:hypothetical protein